MTPSSPFRRLIAVAALMATVAACSSGPAPASPTANPTLAPSPSAVATVAPVPTVSPIIAPTSAPTTSPTTSPTSEPSASAATSAVIFAFAPADILTYWRDDPSTGFTCTAQTQSKYVGFNKTTCSKQDGDLLKVITLVTDEITGDLAGGFAYVDSSAASLKPADASYHLGAFLGTLLGATNGKPAATWLGQNLGSDKGYKLSDDLTLNTYPGTNDPSILYVEIDSQAYLDALAR